MIVLPLFSPADAFASHATVSAHLAADGVIAYPTETVYGFGTFLLPPALERLARLKERTEQKPFLLLHSSPARLPGLSWTPAATVLAGTFWPGPLSIALAADEGYPAQVRSASGTVAVRDTSLAPLRTLLRLLDRPLTSTSANLPGAPAATSLPGLLAVLAQLPCGGDVLVLDGGMLPSSAPSTVVDCSGRRARLMREGAVRLEELRVALGDEGLGIDVA